MRTWTRIQALLAVFCCLTVVFLFRSDVVPQGKYQIRLLRSVEKPAKGAAPLLALAESPEIAAAYRKLTRGTSKGIFKVETAPHPKHGWEEGANVVTTIYDSTGRKVWVGETRKHIFISNNGHNFVSTDLLFGGGVAFYSLDSATPIRRYDIDIGWAAFSADGSYFAGRGEHEVYLFTADGDLLWRKWFAAPSSVAISSEGTYVAVDTRPSEPPPAMTKVLPKTRGEEAEFVESPLASAPAGRPQKRAFVTVVRLDGSSEVLKLDEYLVQRVAFSPNDGEYLLTVANNKLLLFRTETLDRVWEYEVGPPYCDISAIDISDDNSMVVIGTIIYDPVRGGSTGYNIQLLQLEQGTKLAEYDEPAASLTPFSSIAFSPMSKYFVQKDSQKVRVFEIIHQ